MVDKNTQFYAILTNVGAAKQANADALGIAWKITQMGVGDANGTDPTPNATQKALINEWRRAPLNQLKVDDNDPSIIVAEQVIPADIGGMWIREIGLYDEAGDLVAVANCAPTYKPVLSQGSGRTQVLRMSLVVSNAANVQLKIDPSVVLATREWVTEELSRQDFKHSVLVATTANISLSGQQTIDGVAVAAGARVLVKNQAAAKENGIYTVVSGAAWKRSTDADSSAKVTPGLLVLVEAGAVNGDSGWQLVTDAPIALGVTALSFEMAFGRTGVNAGTYKSVQVDKYGRVVAASNPTTAAGYGITDVYTKSETYSRAEIAQAILDSVTKAVNGLVDAAPGTLDTLKELATAIGNDPNFATTMVNELAKKAPLLSPKLTGSPETPTPSASSTGLQIANMSALATAVAAASRQFKTAVIGVSTNLTLTAAQMGNAVQFNGGAVTLALPALADVGNGASVMLRNPSATATQNIVVASSGSIVDAGTTGGTMALKPFEWAELASSGTAWFVVGRGKLKESAEIDSPNFTGTPTAPTAPVGTNTGQIATMAALLQCIMAFGLGSTSVPTIADFNAPSATGFFKAMGNADNSPYTSAVGTLLLLNIQFSANTCLQLVGVATQTQANMKLFWRSQSTTYCDWREVGSTFSPAFTGTPTAPTPGLGDNKDRLATTAFVQATLSASGFGASAVAANNLDFNEAPLNSFVKSEGTEADSGKYNRPLLGVTGSTPVAFTLITVGVPGASRVSQIATQIFPALGSRGRVFSRVLHDSTWYPWDELTRTDSPVLLGTPTAPTAAADTSSKQLATTEFVMGQLASAKPQALGDAAVGNSKRFARENHVHALPTLDALANVTIVSNATGEILRWNGTNWVNNTLAEAGIAPVKSPALEGKPTAPTPSIVDNSSSIATTEFVQAMFSASGLGGAAISGDTLDFNAAPLNSFVKAEGTEATSSTYNRPLLGVAGSTAVAFNLLTMGVPGAFRVTQIAAEVFSVGGVRGRMFSRVRHDSVWSPWQESATLNSPSFTGQPTAPTPRSNDASKLLATTEFVEQSKRNFSGPVLGLSSNMTLTAAQSGRLYQANVKNLVVTIPAPGDAPSGSTFAFRNPTSGTLSITAASGGIAANVSLATLVLQTNECVELVNNTSTDWFVSSRSKTIEAATVDAMNAAVAAAAPPGQVAHFALTSAPTGWLPRNGAAYSRATYAALFAAIGTKFGAGDGSTTFNVPDDRELIDRAWTDGLNAADAGRALFSTQAGQIESHNHTGYTNSAGAHSHTMQFIRERISSGFVPEGGNAVFGDQESDGVQTLTSSTGGVHNHTLNIGNTGGTETRMANRAYLACIKY